MEKKNEIIRILLHGFFLVSLNLFAVMMAFVIVKLFGLPSNRLLQGSLALLVNVLVYVLVFKIMAGVQKEIMHLENISALIITLLISLAILPAVFYPLHYLTRGDWSSFENLLVTWPFQILVNGICLVLNSFILSIKNR